MFTRGARERRHRGVHLGRQTGLVAPSCATPKNPYGHATSLRTWHDRVIVQFDQGEPEDGSVAGAGWTHGATVWEKSRQVGVVGDAHRRRGGGEVAGHHACGAVGDGIRRNERRGVVARSVLKVKSRLRRCLPVEWCWLPVPAKLLAIRPDGTGDATKTHVVWTAEEGAPDVTSPVSNGELLFSVSSGGFRLVVSDAKGRQEGLGNTTLRWSRKRRPPSLANRLLLLLTRRGCRRV